MEDRGRIVGAEGRCAPLVVLALLLGAFAAGARAGELDYRYFLHTLIDLDRLAQIEEGVACKQFSSYDRASRYDEKTDKYINWGANGDCGQYLRKEPDGEAVMAEMEGPGCIVRIWSANPQGKIRFYLDGAPKPTYEFVFAELFQNKVPPFKPLVCGMDGAGANVYLPIPYAKSCKVTADKAHNQYYHIGYKTFPKEAKVATFRLPLSAEESALLDKVVAAWNACGTDPQAPREAKSVARSVDLPAGQPTVLAELEGPAAIVCFKAKLTGEERYALRRVLLRMTWDGEERPSVEAPLGDFFGTGFFANPYRSLPLGMGPEGGYCFWRMPFRKSARIEVVNQGTKPAKLDFEILTRPGELSPNTAYFHAKWRREDPCRVFEYPFLACEGAPGHYVGVMLNVDNPDQGWWGEGDERVYVDGEKFPSTFGTGSEDYFGDAWGFRHFIRPFHGNTLGQGPGFSNKWSVYRWHISDEIPFTRSFRMTIENYGQDKDYSSVAYWYQLHPQKDFFESVPVERRIPRKRTLAGVVEGESLKIEGAAVIDDEGRLDEFSGGKALLLKGKAEQSFDLPVAVPADDVYTVILYSAKGEAIAPFELLSGEATVGKGANAFERSAEFRVGKVRLAKGEARLTLKFTGDGSLALDAFRLEPSRKEGGAIEAEGLRVLATIGPKAAPEDIRLPWSGDSQLLFPATEEGQSVSVALPVQAGRFLLAARFTQGPDYGQVQAFHGDQPLGEPVDCYAARPAIAPQVTLGKVDFAPDSFELKFQAVGKNEKSTGYRVGIDYLRLLRIVVENAIEAERLPIVASEGGGAGPQGLGGFGGSQWSGDTQLFFTPPAKGAYVTLEVSVAQAGRYDLDVYYTKAVDYGIVQLSLDGKAIGQPFDGFNNGVVPSGKIAYGTVELAAGKHQLKFELIGKNPAATGFYAGIDCLTLTPAK